MTVTGQREELGQHGDAVRRLRESYDAIAPGAPVRLAKKTSNLFRPRDAVATGGLDVSGLDGVISVDAAARTADVQGMCTYEDLVDATLPHGLIPYVVPQLRTITLGGAVTGLGIESTSFRNGLPHESVLEMDVFTGAGEIVTARPDNEHADLFATFPNSYGSLGYATRLRIALEPVKSHVALRHVRFHDTTSLQDAIATITETRTWHGEPVDGLDGVAFEPGEYYLTLARWTDAEGAGSDYTGQQIYWRSIQQREVDLLTTYDYLWRWDTDWFWCSGAFGAQNPWLRRVWPRRWRRSDVYQRLLGLDQRFGIANRLDRRAGRPQRERVVQDIEVPVERLGEFLDWFDEHVGMRPVWLCPLRRGVTRRGVTRLADDGPRTRSSRGAPTSTPASGARCTSAQTRRTARGTAPSRPRCRGSTGTRASTPSRSTTARPSTSSTTAPTSRRSRTATTPTTG